MLHLILMTEITSRLSTALADRYKIEPDVGSLCPVRLERYTMRTPVTTCLILVVALGCGGEPGAPDPRPGSFALTHLEGLRQAASLTANTTTASLTAAQGPRMAPAAQGPDFNLGTIRATDRFYFLLGNGGDFSITGITITSSNPAFQVSPTSIDDLQPDTGVTIAPVVRVTSVHGTSPTGIGFTDLMPAGSNTATVSFSGTTTDNDGQSIAVSLDAGLMLNALVMDVRVFDDGGEIDLSTPEGGTTGGDLTGGVAVPFFTVLGSLLVENSGNVAIEITTWYGDRTTESTIIGPGETADLTNAPQGTAGTNYVWLYGGGTVSDQSRLPVTQNGQVIFVFLRN